MNTKSEKSIYENKLQMKAVRFCTDIFVWGEDLTDKKLIIYPQKVKCIDDYISKKDRLKACGVVLINPEDSDPVHLVTATVDIESGDLYVHESGFNPMWKYLRNSINAGIKMSWENTGKCAIAEPEEIVVSDYIQRPGLSAVLRNGVLEYEKRELTAEEKNKISRKQSLIDNAKMLYYYSDKSQYYHDKSCKDINAILPKHFQASEIAPTGMKACYKCRRNLFLRIACYPNTKQIPICDRIFRKYKIDDRKLYHYVIDVGMRFHATDYYQMQVEGVEDNWIIEGLYTGKTELRHNNYVKTSSTERYITEGFHKQNVEHSKFEQLLNYIETYSWKKHLDNEEMRGEMTAERNE